MKFVPPSWLDAAQALLTEGRSIADCSRELELTKGRVAGHVARGHLVLPAATREKNLSVAAKKKLTVAKNRGATETVKPVLMPMSALSVDFRTEKQRLRDELAAAWRNTAAMARE